MDKLIDIAKECGAEEYSNPDIYDNLKRVVIDENQLLAIIEQVAGPLVEALEDANKKIRKAKDFEYESQEHISESAYELNGFLGSTAAEISVNWQKTIDNNNELLTRAKELTSK